MHLWKGNIINNEDLSNKFLKFATEFQDALQRPLAIKVVLDTIQAFNVKLTDDELVEYLIEDGITLGDAKQEIFFLRDFISADNLKQKLERELGGENFQDLIKNRNEINVFEGKRPLGVLLHITPSNSPIVSFLAVIEGLLSGNINLLKLSYREGNFSVKVFERLLNCDVTGKLKDYIYILKISSKEKEKIKNLLSISNGVSVWGGEQAVKEIRNLAPAQCKVIPWGHKISFAYISKDYFKNKNMLINLASDCVSLEQQACSSPQCIFLDTDSYEEVKLFAHSFFNYMEKESLTKENPVIDQATICEITNTSEMVKLEEVMNDSLILEDSKKTFRIYVEKNSKLTPSPLYRSVWIRPLPLKDINRVLFSWRNHLQTIGLAGDFINSKELVQTLINSGATRITEVGKMLDNYQGEAHDGVYPLQAFTQEVRVALSKTEGISRLSYDRVSVDNSRSKVMTKSDFQKLEHNTEKAKLFFKSGGSSGKTALSSFSYSDYYKLMDAASEGLIASGLEPAQDRVINLFFGGGLYGGMISFFTILEKMKAIQYTMGACIDFDFVIDMIIQNKINTLVGMTSYMLQLLGHDKVRLKKYGRINKIFYGGEHFPDKQKDWVRKEFGITMIKSASYGSVDAGPLGYQCQYTVGSIHHLHDHIHFMEILKLNSDEKVDAGEIGRLIFSTPGRETLMINRYEIGDMGRWIENKCACGRTSPLFELMGRMGDVFKASGTFINYQKVERILHTYCAYEGEMQIELLKINNLDKMIVKIDRTKIETKNYYNIIIDNYKDLNEVVLCEQSLELEIKTIGGGDFERTAGSGKLIRVLDKRM